jgi:AraC-like DNA-binding protein
VTISQVANRLGYQDVYHFSKQFRQKQGIPPSEFRDRHEG